MNTENSGLYALNISKAYGAKYVVSNVTIEVQRGEVVGLLGPNGAGKTTTFQMIIGFLRPKGGKIILDGRDITNLPVYQRARLGIGYLPQEASIFRKLTVVENIRAVLELTENSHQGKEETLSEILDKLGISHLKDRRGETLSGGERRRAELARALALKPSFLLLDEPFTGIDPIAREEIQNIIRNLAKENLGILVTDHNVRETLEITDRAYLIYDSRILFAGSAHELIANESARKFYLGARFRI
ncbi:MAG: LPS export ABC transporter ATP-binding protein [candidate division WOR-3 bacterium]